MAFRGDLLRRRGWRRTALPSMDNDNNLKLIWIKQSRIDVVPADLLEQGADGAAGFPIG